MYVFVHFCIMSHKLVCGRSNMYACVTSNKCKWNANEQVCMRHVTYLCICHNTYKFFRQIIRRRIYYVTCPRLKIACYNNHHNTRCGTGFHFRFTYLESFAIYQPHLPVCYSGLANVYEMDIFLSQYISELMRCNTSQNSCACVDMHISRLSQSWLTSQKKHT